MTGNISQYVKSIVHDTRNRVNDGMKCVGKGLWHEDCIIHYWKTAETAFLALLHTEWCKKRCFCVHAIRSEKGNNVSCRFHENLLTETM